jgi:hypothetical protein
MDMHDRLFVETDDSCAVCGIRGISALTEHHIDTDRSNNTYDNLIVLCHNCHHSFHNLKGLTNDHIIERKRHLIQKTITTYGLSAMKIAKEENQMGYGEQQDATARFAMTDEGRALLSKWFA